MSETMYSKTFTPSQTELLEHALRLVTGIGPLTWQEIPSHLHHSFAKHMDKDLWTSEVDLLSLSEAAMMILRDAIARTGEFASVEP
jgi:hypothetical protein